MWVAMAKETTIFIMNTYYCTTHTQDIINICIYSIGNMSNVQHTMHPFLLFSVLNIHN